MPIAMSTLQQSTSLPRRAATFAACSLLALTFVPGDAAAAGKSVRMHVQAPVDFNNPGATRLDSIENYGPALFNQQFEIPYTTLEKLIDDKLDALVPNTIGDTVVCSDPCPDVTWSIKITPTFKFTKKNQPVLTKLGSSGEAKVRVELASQAKISIHAAVHVETWFETIDVPVDVFVVIGVKAKVDVKLWPKIDPGDVDLEFTLDDGDIDLELNGTAVSLGAKWGTLVGLSPVGLLVGGPILGPILAALGNEAADIAEQKLSDAFYSRADTLLAAATGNLEDMVNDYIEPYVTQANDIKASLLGKKLDGVGQTLEQLMTKLGAKIDLHTVTPGGGLAASAVMRMSGAAAGGRIEGSLRLPNKTCKIAKVNSGPLAGTVIPLGLVPTNEDLKAKVGQKCSAVLGRAGIDSSVYLGANPQTVLGKSAQHLASWKRGGSLTYSGTLKAEADWYACSFEIGSLPAAAIVELETTGAIVSRHVEVDARFLEVTAAGKSVVFDQLLDPVNKSQVILGGAGVCPNFSSGGAAITPGKAKELEDLLDPENCPQCGIKVAPGSEHIIEIANGEGFAKTSLGKSISKNLSRAKAKTSGQAPAKAGAPKSGVAKPGAAKSGVNPAAGQ